MKQTKARIVLSILALGVLLATGLADDVHAARRRAVEDVEGSAARPVGEPLLAIVSLRHQKITVYDADGWILRAPISSGRAGYETPAGIYSVLQKEADHYSNLYDDAAMPFMQRITWSGIALHAGDLPGYPASHGCVRLPYDFAERLFGMTKVGMRVIVARNDIHPVEVEHPRLFEPASALPTLDEIAATKASDAKAAARRANAARLAAARLAGEAARLVPAAQGAKVRAEAQLSAADWALAAASSPQAVRAAEEAKARALARFAEAEALLSAAEVEAPLKAEAAARAREEAQAAEAERIAASEAAREAKRKAMPVSIFISRKTERLYVRQAFEDVVESPVTIREADRPIGTHVFTALGHRETGAGLRWNVVSVSKASDGSGPDPDGSASAALDRIDVPQDVAERISTMISPGSSLIVSDEALSGETGKETDFVILMSGEPQGGIKKRRPAPQARDQADSSYDRPARRSSAYPAPLHWGDPYGPW